MRQVVKQLKLVLSARFQNLQLVFQLFRVLVPVLVRVLQVLLVRLVLLDLILLLVVDVRLPHLLWPLVEGHSGGRVAVVSKVLSGQVGARILLAGLHQLAEPPLVLPFLHNHIH